MLWGAWTCAIGIVAWTCAIGIACMHWRHVCLTRVHRYAFVGAGIRPPASSQLDQGMGIACMGLTKVHGNVHLCARIAAAG